MRLHPISISVTECNPIKLRLVECFWPAALKEVQPTNALQQQQSIQMKAIASNQRALRIPGTVATIHSMCAQWRESHAVPTSSTAELMARVRSIERAVNHARRK
jgi:hypothetical protein